MNLAKKKNTRVHSEKFKHFEQFKSRMELSKSNEITIISYIFRNLRKFFFYVHHHNNTSLCTKFKQFLWYKKK